MNPSRTRTSAGKSGGTSALSPQPDGARYSPLISLIRTCDLYLKRVTKPSTHLSVGPLIRLRSQAHVADAANLLSQVHKWTVLLKQHFTNAAPHPYIFVRICSEVGAKFISYLNGLPQRQAVTRLVSANLRHNGLHERLEQSRRGVSPKLHTAALFGLLAQCLR